MSKAKKNRTKKNVRSQQKSVDSGRRRFLYLGLGGLGTLAIAGYAGYQVGWFGSAAAPDGLKALPPVKLTATSENARKAVDEMLSHYTRELQDPSSLIHSVRAFGKDFKLKDGTLAVDFLCSRFAADKEINGRRYVFFPRDIEAHDNSFLKTFLEAGVSRNQTITVGNIKYTLSDLGESAKALFRCDPENLAKYDSGLLHHHIPWGLIAFSILVPAAEPTWTNAYGETIDMPAVIDKSLAAFEASCSGVRDLIARGEEEPIHFREEMSKYSCYGLHAVYSYLSCLKNEFLANDLNERMREMYDTVIHRLQGDSEAIDNESAMAKMYGGQYVAQMGRGPDGRSETRGAPPPNVIEMMSLRHQIKFFGHAFECLNYAKLHGLFTPSFTQQTRIEAGEKRLYQLLVDLRSSDLAPFLYWYPKFITEFNIALGHASRGIKLLTPDNPDRSIT